MLNRLLDTLTVQEVLFHETSRIVDGAHQPLLEDLCIVDGTRFFMCDTFGAIKIKVSEFIRNNTTVKEPSHIVVISVSIFLGVYYFQALLFLFLCIIGEILW